MRNLLYRITVNLLYSRTCRKIIISLFEKITAFFLKPGKKNSFSGSNITIQNEKKIMAVAAVNAIGRSIEKGFLKKDVSEATLKLWANALLSTSKRKGPVKEFYKQNNADPPFLLVISPGHACNLKCADCYAASGAGGSKLSWEIVERIISDAKNLWGIKLVVFSGGEPFAWSGQNRDILDIAFKNPDLLFLAFTNGTLIDKKTAGRIAACKNITPAFSVEGMGPKTDERRGKGIFGRITAAMDLMKEAGAPFGISVTVNRNNCASVLSGEFLDFFFKKMGAFYGFYFQYLPMGRNADFGLMPTPGQRLKFRELIWKVIEDKKLFLLDFWNHGTLVNGCIAAGRGGGYIHIDWNGNVMPCVFTPYSAGNIADVYRSGGNLDNIWNSPFLSSIRNWQKQQGHGRKNTGTKNLESIAKGNLLTPCPYRDHYEQFIQLVKQNNSKPQDDSAAMMLNDAQYYKKMASYDRELEKLFDPVWQQKYTDK
ncbi:MAG: radical SAM protein [Actinobacteria bacterium]|nr:radical SAM protein [Actinomycetota bacterium]